MNNFAKNGLSTKYWCFDSSKLKSKDYLYTEATLSNFSNNFQFLKQYIRKIDSSDQRMIIAQRQILMNHTNLKQTELLKFFYGLISTGGDSSCRVIHKSRGQIFGFFSPFMGIGHFYQNCLCSKVVIWLTPPLNCPRGLWMPHVPERPQTLMQCVYLT